MGFPTEELRYRRAILMKITKEPGTLSTTLQLVEIEVERIVRWVCFVHILTEDLCAPGTVLSAGELAVNETKPACRGERHREITEANKKI